MKIGIISDSHDDMAMIERAVSELNARDVGKVLHAGDFVAPFTIERLDRLNADIIGIFGNNDGDRILLNERFGGRIHNQPHTLSLGEPPMRIVMVHEPKTVEALAKSGLYDVVIYGHTHIPDIKKIGSALVINPGKLARIHKGKTTFAVLDTESMEAEIIEL